MATVYLIPSLLSEEGLDAIPPYILDAIKNSQIFFVENERTTRRYFKQLWKEMIIYTLPLLIVGFGGVINETFDRIMLGWWSGAAV